MAEAEIYAIDTFEDDSVGQSPSRYTVVGINGTTANTMAFDGNKSLRVYDNSSVLTNVVKITNADISKKFECKIYTVAAPNGNIISINSEGNNNSNSVFHIGIFNDGSLKWFNGTSWITLMGTGEVQFNTWNTIRIEAPNTTTAFVYFNGTLEGTIGKWNVFSTMDRIRLMSGSSTGTGDNFYVDNLIFN